MPILIIRSVTDRWNPAVAADTGEVAIATISAEQNSLRNVGLFTHTFLRDGMIFVIPDFVSRI